MKPALCIPIVILLFAICIPAATIDGTFTYQGRLTDRGTAVNGSYDLRFILYNAEAGGSQAGSIQTNTAVTVTDGGFTAPLNFGAGIFDGTAYWLEISVRTNSGGSFVPLWPRQPLTPSPYAVYTPRAGSVAAGAIGAAELATGAVTSTKVANNAVTSAKIAAGQVVKSVNELRDDLTLTAGTNVVIKKSASSLTFNATNIWQLNGNTGTKAGVQFLGTTDDVPLDFRVNNTRALRLEYKQQYGFDYPNLIAGASNNVINSHGSTIGGGSLNTIASGYGLIGGGHGNSIRTDAYNSVIGGGQDNSIGEGANTSFIGGGFSNDINDGAMYSVIPGGTRNTVEGDYGFAAGRKAKALHNGCFVWGDSSDRDVVSVTNNQFVVRASGGAVFYSSSRTNSGAQLKAGENSWSSVSDQNLKKNRAPVDGREILEKLAAMPVDYWQYSWEDDHSTPHIGPMAQDFKGAFYPGRDNKTINTMEVDGVALAAIQGLNRKLLDELKARDAEIQSLQTMVRDLKAMIEALPLKQ